MKVGIDISFLGTGHQYRGVGSYTENLIKEFQSVKVPNLSIQLIKSGKITTDCDLVHYPHFDLFFLTLPLQKPKPTIVTIHDVIPLIFPEHYLPGIRGKIKFLIQKFSLRGVNAVITDSENSKMDIVRYLGYPEKKIYVVYLAHGDNFKPCHLTILQRRNIVRRYGLPERFVLYVGDVNYNKNIPGLIRAFAKLVKTTNNPPAGRAGEQRKLVLVGKAFMDMNLMEAREIVQLVKLLKLEDMVIRLGWVPKEDLVKIYNLATIYCQPSFYEGFGLPVLEAMACGCPVVAANTASLPEICGEAALMVNPYNEEEMAHQFKDIIENEQLRRDLIQKGFLQVKKFSWRKTVLETIGVYEKLVSKN